MLQRRHFEALADALRWARPGADAPREVYQAWRDAVSGVEPRHD
jgi:hypothetical protein